MAEREGCPDAAVDDDESNTDVRKLREEYGERGEDLDSLESPVNWMVNGDIETTGAQERGGWRVHVLSSVAPAQHVQHGEDTKDTTIRQQQEGKDVTLESVKQSHKLETDRLKSEITDLKQKLDAAEAVKSNAERDVTYFKQQYHQSEEHVKKLTKQLTEREILRDLERSINGGEDRQRVVQQPATFEKKVKRQLPRGHPNCLEFDPTLSREQRSSQSEIDTGFPSSMETDATEIKSSGH